MLTAIVFTIVLHAQNVLPIVGSTQGSTGTTPASKITGVAFSSPVAFSKPVAFQ